MKILHHPAEEVDGARGGNRAVSVDKIIAGYFSDSPFSLSADKIPLMVSEGPAPCKDDGR